MAEEFRGKGVHIALGPMMCDILSIVSPFLLTGIQEFNACTGRREKLGRVSKAEHQLTHCLFGI